MRQVDTDLVARVLHGIALRVAIGVGAACSSLDADAADEMRRLVDSVQRGLAMVDDTELRAGWLEALRGVADQANVHGAVAGRATRLLLDGGRIDHVDAGRRVSRQLSRGTDMAESAAWLDGFLSGDAVLLLHDDALLEIIDGWLAEVPGELFDDLLPLVRRTFSAFSKAERRLIGEKLRRVGTAPPEPEITIDMERARRAVPVLRQILGARG